MTADNIIALLGAMIALAILPSPSVFAVVARSISSGFTHGLMTAIGILAGDYIFIFLTISGLSAIATNLGSLFTTLKYLGAAYLIWTGTKLCLVKSKSVEFDNIEKSSWLSSFLSGLFITLADSKAIFFYMSFFPAFLDLKNVSVVNLFIVMEIVTVAVGGVKIGYAYLADRAKLLFKSSKAQKVINLAAGSVMIGTAIVIIAKT